MKKFICLILLSGLLSVGHAQISGIKSIPGDYPTIKSAITALNTSGVGSGGVTFNIAAGYTETFDSLTAGFITATGTATNPIIFQKSGSGPNPVITAASPGTGTTDYVICLAGSDYVTFDGINISENPLNTTSTQMMERGYALLKNSGTDGCQYVTIKNCSIHLNGTNTSSYGIYSDNATPAAPGAQLTVTADGGTNSNINIQNDSIYNCGNGIYFTGYNDYGATHSYYDHDNTIGAGGGNIITNLGTTSGTVYGIKVSFQNNITVSQNTLNGSVQTTYYGIYMGFGNNSSFEISNNTISVQCTISTPGVNGIYNNMGSNGTSNTVNIINNNISGNNMSTLTTGSFNGIYNTATIFNLNCNNNSLNNNIMGGATTASTGAFNGIYNSATQSNTGSTWNFGNNTITGNQRPYVSQPFGTNNFIYSNGGAKTTNFYYNVVSNNSNYTVGGTYLLYYANNGSTLNMYSNQLINYTSGGGTIYGAYIGSHSTGFIHENKIENIVSNGAFILPYSPTVYGLYLGISFGTDNIYNNFIGDLQVPYGNNTNSLVALTIPALSSCSLVGNTIQLDATSTEVGFGSYLIYANAMCPLDMRNNILINTTIPTGAAQTYIIYRTYNDFSTLPSTNNNNDMYMGAWGATKYFFLDGTVAVNSIQDYKSTMYPRETVSFSENPHFVNTTTHPYDFHINPAFATQCESGGQVISSPISINQDIDGNMRYPNSGYPDNPSSHAIAPDAGADEFAGIKLDLIPPVINCTPLSNTSSTDPRTLTATITDVTGVPVGGTGLPRVYWKKNSTGSWNAATGTFVSATQYSFTFGSGVSMGDTIIYYIAAQDNAPIPNVSAFPGFGSGSFSANPPYSNPPTNPMSYRIIHSISGIIPVGVGQTYTTLTNALNDISGKEFVGPVVLELHDTTYPAEVYPIYIEPSVGLSATNTLTIRPYSGVSVHISGNSSSGLLRIDGANYVTIDGSNSNGTDRNLIIENTTTSMNSFTLGFFNKNGVGASRCVIKNCKIKASSQLSNATQCVYFDSNGGGYNDNVINNNQIYSAKFGIWLRNGNRNKITNNTIGSTDPQQEITYRSINLMNVDSTLISNNDIFNNAAAIGNYGQCGVYLFSSSHDTRIISNKIHDMVYSGGTFSNYGIYFASDASTVTEISNNLFYNIACKAKPFCIMFGTGGNVRCYHNTFYLSGSIMSGTSTTYSACININNNNITQLDFQDNIFKNSTQPVSANPNVNSYAIYNAGPVTAFAKLDHNDYYIDGNNPNIGYQGSALQTLAMWQTATSQDSSSLVMDPVFNNPTDLIPTKDSLNNKGYYLASVPTDFYGNLRSNPPDQGAINFGLDPVIITDSASSVLYNSAVLNGTVNAHTVLTTITFDYGLTTAYGSWINANPNTLSDTTNTAVSASLTNLAYLTTYHFRAHGVTPAGVHFYGRDFTFTTPAAPPLMVTLPATGIAATTATLNGTANARTSITSVIFEYGLTTSYGTQVTAVPSSVSDTVTFNETVAVTGLLPNATYHYRITGNNIGGTGHGADMTFNTPAILPVVVTNLPTSIGANSAQLNGTVMANNSSTNIFFQYGLTTAYGSIIASSPDILNGMASTPVAANLSGLLINETYHYRCVGSNIAGTSFGQDQVFTTNCVPPAISINGPGSTCAGVSGYIYTTQSGNNNYEWNISSGGIITSGAGTPSITVTWNTAGPQFVAVNYSNQYNCSLGAPSVYNVNVNAVPNPTISGPSTACAHSTGNTYSTQAGMSGYVWTLSTGGTITSGNGTSSIVVTWNTPGEQTVSVNYTNPGGCDALTPAVQTVTVNTLPVPTVSGPADLCMNSGYISYNTETGMSGYIWTLSAGGTITGGQGTPTVQVTWNEAGAQSVSVNYSNSLGCFAQAPTEYPVTVNAVPGAAGTISGESQVCAGATGVSYSCAPISDAAYYVWTLPEGATIATGEGSSSVTVDFASNAASGNITVYGNNLCGNGTESPALSVTVSSLPATPGNISGPNQICQGETGVIYSVDPIAGTTSYTWTVPGGAVIVSGNNTNAITVDFPASATSGAVAVFGSNSCGNGPVSSMTVTISPKPASPLISLIGNSLHSDVTDGNQWYLEGNAITGATGQNYEPAATGLYWDVVTVNGCQSDTSNNIYYVMLGVNEQHSAGFSLYPVPNDGSFTVSIFSPSLQSFTLRIYNNIGVEVYQSGSFEVNGTALKPIDLRPVPNGLYTVILQTTDSKVVKKFLVSK